MENEDPIENEGGLIRAGNPIFYKGRPTGVPFRKDLKDNINDCYWTEMTDIGRSMDFGDEQYYPIVKAGNVHQPWKNSRKRARISFPRKLGGSALASRPGPEPMPGSWA